jgi:hypothetical protein
MPDDVRCFWIDEIGVVLDGSIHDEFQAAYCGQGIAIEKRIWWRALRRLRQAMRWHVLAAPSGGLSSSGPGKLGVGAAMRASRASAT